MKKCIELSIYSVNNSECIQSLSEFQESYCEFLEKPENRSLYVIEHIIDEVRKTLELEENNTVTKGISDGCYGARPGTQSKGLTVWIDPLELCERYVDSEGDEIVNVAHLLNDHAEYKSELDPESIIDFIEDSGAEIKHDNSYNWQGQNSENPLFMFDFDFKLIEFDESVYMIVKFHCGGDPRGNYTDEMVFKFEYIDDVYSVIYPLRELTDEI